MSLRYSDIFIFVLICRNLCNLYLNFLIYLLFYLYNFKINYNSLMNNELELYADFVTDKKSNDMFVITPEGNRFKFDAPEYNESHEPVNIVDPWSHKMYTVYFDV